jgi:hypothetical protein
VGTACTEASASGLRGIVLTQRSPVCIEGRACLEPIAGITLVFHREGRAVARTTSRVGGAYRVRLPGGRYRVTIAHSMRIRVMPARVRVVRGVVRRLDFEIGRGLQ